MIELVAITLRPCSNYDFHDLKYLVNLYDNNYNLAVREAIRRAKKSFKNTPVIDFDVISIELV